MPGPGFRALSAEAHHGVSSKGGKATMLKRHLRFKQWQACTPVERRERGRNGGKMSALTHKVIALETRIRQLEESR